MILFINRIVPDSHNSNCTVNCTNEQVKDEKQEESHVVLSQTIVHPGTMMIHGENARVTNCTMVCSRRFDFVTTFALLGPDVS